MEKKRDEEIKSGIGQRDLQAARRFVFFSTPPSSASPRPFPLSSDPAGLRRANGDQDLEKIPKQLRRVSRLRCATPPPPPDWDLLKFYCCHDDSGDVVRL